MTDKTKKFGDVNRSLSRMYVPGDMITAHDWFGPALIYDSPSIFDETNRIGSINEGDIAIVIGIQRKRTVNEMASIPDPHSSESMMCVVTMDGVYGWIMPSCVQKV